MFQERELIAMWLSLALFAYVVLNRRTLATIAHSKLLVAAVVLTVIARTLSLSEGLFWSEQQNLLEHLLNVCSVFCLVGWIWCHLGNREAPAA